jgi:SAM-dependent methyltransferase
MTSAAPDRTEYIAYLDYVTQSSVSQQGRPDALAALDLRPGLTALDVGCGPGTNLPDLAAGVTAAGRVIGVDHDPEMLAEARRRTTGLPVELRQGDAHDLPVEDQSVDRARVDRMLQHVTDPARVVAELYRVTRPGGLICLYEPDWATLAVASADAATSRAFTEFTCAQVRNFSVGRQLPALAAAAGFTVRSAQPAPGVWHDFEEADVVLGLSRLSARAVQADRLSPEGAEAWLAGLRRGPFVAAALAFRVVAER